MKVCLPEIAFAKFKTCKVCDGKIGIKLASCEEKMFLNVVFFPSS